MSWGYASRTILKGQYEYDYILHYQVVSALRTGITLAGHLDKLEPRVRERT